MVAIAPSILSADFSNLQAAIEAVERAGARLIHLDIMDGHFVPNLTIGPPVVASLRKATRLLLDAHLMISDPYRYVPAFLKAGANMISVHAEADAHLNRTVNLIRDGGARPGVALNPATPIQVLYDILPELDFVLLMTVNPGFGGQPFIGSSLDKIRRLKTLLLDRRPEVQIEVDGGIVLGNIGKVVEAGADIVVAGSAIFDHGNPQAALEAMNQVSWKLAVT
ncbi:MAG: ribulose-phosphate 3-epimerase [Acidobacteria bacterium]|nr:ribulose-phosphate 3-epimerase [Acidobacteriota bacterium]MBI3657487.1 ribulose-phosphate 3-epimerase [Acidobacteriota bacterium]